MEEMVTAKGNAIIRKARLTLLIAVTPGRTSERTPRDVVMMAMASPQLVKNLSKPAIDSHTIGISSRVQSPERSDGHCTDPLPAR